MAYLRLMEACPSVFRFCHYAWKCNYDVVPSAFFRCRRGQTRYEHMEFAAWNVAVASKWWKLQAVGAWVLQYL